MGLEIALLETPELPTPEEEVELAHILVLALLDLQAAQAVQA